MRGLAVIAAALAVGGCASQLAASSNDDLVREMVEIRPWDGHTGFAAPEGLRSYGWEAKEVLVDRGPAAVPSLADALRDPRLDPTQRRIVRDAIGEIGPDARAAVPALLDEMRGADARTVERVCFTLRRMGWGASQAVPDLVRLLRERGDDIASPGFAMGDVVSPPSRLRTSLVLTLGAIGPPAEPALPILAEGAVQTDDVEYRRVCRAAMRNILGPSPWQ